MMAAFPSPRRSSVPRRATRCRWILGALALGLATTGCPAATPAPSQGSPTRPEPASPDELGTTGQVASRDPQGAVDDLSHRVVFADRTSQSYVLLLPPDGGASSPDVPTRDELVALVEREFASSLLEEEVRLLIELVRKEPSATPQPVQLSFDPEDEDSIEIARRTAMARGDLLGLHVESGNTEDFVPALALEDPVLLRALSARLRDSISTRRRALLVRADYRNQHAFRGLRLLQTLVRLLARERDALVHDPDTLETVDLDVFTRRRLQSTLANVADQIVVVPFPDPRHGEGFVRLTTRGMRRFGSVDLELDGLPADPQLLQRATDFLVGVALVMAREAELDATGLAIELDDVIGVHYADAVQGYAGREGKPPRCTDCPEQAQIHVVERPSEPQDPHDHVVARVVAPRPISDAPEYDHRAWVADAIADVFGPHETQPASQRASD